MGCDYRGEPSFGVNYAGNVRSINDEMDCRVGGPGPAYVNQDRAEAMAKAPRSEGLSALDQTVDMLHCSMQELESRIDMLQGKLHLPPIYDVPQPAAAQATAGPEHRLGFLLMRMNQLGSRIDRAAGNLTVFGAKLD